MTDLKKKFIVVFFPVFVLLIWSFVIMIKSFNSNENWRIVCSSLGFVIIFALTFFFVKAMIKKLKTEKE